jgi:hypothetical protein
MVKSLKHEHGNKSRRKSSRIKQRGGATAVVNEGATAGANEESDLTEYYFFLYKIFDNHNIIEILKKFPDQSFKEINDAIINLFKNPTTPEFTIEQLCGLLYVLMYKIDKVTYPINNFPNIENKELAANRINYFKSNINSIKDEHILFVLLTIINAFKKQDSTIPQPNNIATEQSFNESNVENLIRYGSRNED